MLILVEDEQVGEKEEGERDEGVEVEVGPQEGKAAHLQAAIQSNRMRAKEDSTRKRRVRRRTGSWVEVSAERRARSNQLEDSTLPL